MPLTLRLKTELILPVDADGLLPERLGVLTSNEIARLPLPQGNRSIPCEELFEVDGTAAEDGELQIHGDCRKLKGIGAGMSTGRILVEGSAGMHLGRRMRGGEIVVTGDASDWTGAEMRSGQIRVQGSVGHHAGGAYPGSKKGMTGGRLFVHGQAGTFVGNRMRRGWIVVLRSAEDAAGAGMVAGTICLLGGCHPEAAGSSLGVGMKRGTILVGDNVVSSRLPRTFSFAATARPVFLNLLMKELHEAGFTVPAEWRSAPFDCYRGDSLERGLGELFFPHTQSEPR
ncbi:MAG TPA: formylmethanofuran dehydrogenase subunit C [Planctomicrobium sp.]|nr:formylmethanofuran dehydrogenase subunit C [Planctomicrobium sp.]